MHVSNKQPKTFAEFFPVLKILSVIYLYYCTRLLGYF